MLRNRKKAFVSQIWEYIFEKAVAEADDMTVVSKNCSSKTLRYRSVTFEITESRMVDFRVGNICLAPAPIRTVAFGEERLYGAFVRDVCERKNVEN